MSGLPGDRADWHSYDQAQLISSACDFAKLSTILHSPGIPEDQLRKDRSICELLAADILDYCLRDLLSPLGGFFGAEDADSAPALGAKKLGKSGTRVAGSMLIAWSEGAFYLWTKEGFDDTVCEDAELVGYYLGVQEDGNVPAKHDAHGEMTGKVGSILGVLTIADLLFVRTSFIKLIPLPTQRQNTAPIHLR